MSKAREEVENPLTKLSLILRITPAGVEGVLIAAVTESRALACCCLSIIQRTQIINSRDRRTIPSKMAEAQTNVEVPIKTNGEPTSLANEEVPVASMSKGCCANTKQFFLYDNHRKDVQAFYFNQFGRSILFISFMFLSLGVLELANQQVRAICQLYRVSLP